MPTYIKERNDIGILRSDGTTYVGLMLATIDGKPAYRTSTERYLKNQYYAGAPDYGALDPQSELPIIMDDWRSGYGLEVATSADPYRYYSSIGMDLRHRGMAIAGWTPTTVTMPTHTASGWNQALCWDDPDGVWSDEANAIDGATGTKATSTDANYLYLYIPAISCSKIRYYWTELNPNAVEDLEIGVYYEGAWHVVVSDDSQGEGVLREEALAATKTVTAARVKISPTVTGYLHVLEFYAESAAITGTTTAFADFYDEFYATLGNTLIKLHSGGTTLTAIGAFPANITDLEPFPDNHLYIACGTAEDYWYADTADTIVKSTAGTANYQFFATVHGTAPTMWGNDGVNTLRSTVDPLNAGTAWSGTTAVGSNYHDITDLISWKGLPYIMKEDKPYYLDSTPAIQDDLARELESALKSTSGKNAWVWKNELHIPCGDQALLHTDSTTNTFINPSKYCTNLTDFVGRVFAGAGDEEWNYVVVENASTTEVEVMATRIETIGGTTGRVWHPIAEITLKGCNACHISTKVAKRLWIASDDATDSLYYLPLPTTYGDIINDSNKKFKDGVSFITSGQHGGFKGEDKYWRKATATLGHTYDADVYYELHFMRLGDGDYADPADGGWVDVGDFVGSTASMTQSLYIPANTEGVSPVTPMMWFKLVAQSNTSTDLTPELLSLDIRAILKPPSRKIIECAVRCADNIQDKDGHYLEGTGAADTRTVLDEARDSTVPFTFYDPWGASHTCIMLPNDPESNLQTDLKNENPEQIYWLRMQEVTIA